jgi:hypothetical protein
LLQTSNAKSLFSRGRYVEVRVTRVRLERNKR